MSGPPLDVPPDELVAKLSEARPSVIVQLPRREVDGGWLAPVRILVLTAEHERIAKMMAQAELRKSAAQFGMKQLDAVDMTSKAITETLGDMIVHELLVMACRYDKPIGGEPEDPVGAAPQYTRFFRDAAHVRSTLTNSEIAVLYGAYLLVQDRFGPFERNVQTKEDQDAWIARLQSGMDDPLDLARLPLPLLAEVSTSLAARLFTTSRLLRSQWQSLPDTLRSSLEPFCMDTSFFGTQPEGSTEGGSGRSETDPMFVEGELTTMDQARELARKLMPGGSE